MVELTVDKWRADLADSMQSKLCSSRGKPKESRFALHSRNGVRLYAAARRIGDWFAVSEIEGSCTIHQRNVYVYLQLLVRAGLLEQKGRRCGRRYRAVDCVPHESKDIHNALASMAVMWRY